MKKVIKIVLLVILLACIGFEGFILLKKDGKVDSSKEDSKKAVIAQAFTTYKTNGLRYNLKEKDNMYYYQIHGLKDEELEEKINDLIYDKCIYISKNYKDEFNTHVIGNVVGSYANVLSMEFGLGYVSEYGKENNSISVSFVYDTLNIDLNTGNELTIDDVALSLEGIRVPLSTEVYDHAAHRQGFIGFGFNTNPRYDRVEEAVMSVINKFNAKNFKFSFDAKQLNLFFDGVLINSPKIVFLDEYSIDEYTEEEIKEIKDTCERLRSEDSYYDDTAYLCADNYETTYSTSFPFYYLADDLIIYDSYLSKESLYEDDGEELLKYSYDKKDNDFVKKVLYEEDNSIYDFGGLSSYSFDFDGENQYCNVSFDKVKKQIFSDMKDKLGGEYKVYNIMVGSWSLTKGCVVPVVVTTYQLDKDSYEKYKNKVYTKRLLRDDYSFVDNESKYGYPFLDEYEHNESYFTYVFDLKTSELMEPYKLINPKFDLKDYIPDKWSNNKDELIKNLYITTNDKIKYKDRLGIYIISNFWGYSYKLIYQDDSVLITGEDEMELEELLYWYEESSW